MSNPPTIHVEARRLVAAGLSIIPICVDGTKRPSIAWKDYQTRRPSEEELTQWFQGRAVGLAVVGGRISGDLEILDFDAHEIFEPWCALVNELSPGLLARLPLVRTPPAGYHLDYRCPVIEGNLKLAQRLGAHDRPETLIETRGEGGYAIIPPSLPDCHPSKRPYILLRGDLAAIPPITPEERACLLNAAKSFNEYVKSERILSGHASAKPREAKGERPGDLFNAHADWRDILEPHGWTRVGQRDEVTLWKRLGKTERGISATTNFGGSDLLFNFSTNAWPFEHERAYDKFSALAVLEFGHDFSATARYLAMKGYRKPRSGEVLPPLHDPWLGPRWRMHGVPLMVRRIGQEVSHG